MGRVHVNGRTFAHDRGIFRPVYASALTLCAPGKDWQAFMRYVLAADFNGFRVFCGALSWADQTPEMVRALLPSLVQYAEDLQLAVELTIHTDTRVRPYDKDQHLREILAIVRGARHITIELANEFPHATQDSDVNSSGWLRKRVDEVLAAGIPCAIGAPTADEPTVDGRWDGVGGTYGTAHLDRGRDPFNMVRRVREIEACSDVGDFPVVNNEPIGAAEPGTPGQRLTDPTIFFTMGALNRLFEVPGVFHFQDGLHCTLPVGPTQDECARQFVQASHVFDYVPERLTYKNTGWADSPVRSADFSRVVRVYSGVSGDRAMIVYVGVTGEPNVQFQNGWSISRELARSEGPSGSTFVFEATRDHAALAPEIVESETAVQEWATLPYRSRRLIELPDER